MNYRWIPLIAMVVAARPLAAQGHEHHASGVQLSPKALAQVAEARQVAAAFDTPDKARAAGYLPRFGDVPLQGEHWIRRELVMNASFDIAHPPVLMFSRVKDVETLVGVAYAYQVTDAAPTPDGFDGDADQWHEHPLLSMAGRRETNRLSRTDCRGDLFP